MMKQIMLSLIFLIGSTLCDKTDMHQSMQATYELYCEHIEPLKLIDLSEYPTLNKACDQQKIKDVIKKISPIVMSDNNHPMVQTHRTIWYRNWLTCEVCNTWSATFKDIITDPHKVKALKGFLWAGCSVQYSQSFCKYFIGETVDLLNSEAYQLVLNQNFICGYYFDLCNTNYYTALDTKTFIENMLEKRPDEIINNNALDMLYQTQRQGQPFKVLWLSDIDIDLNYVYESSTVCVDQSCCHAQNVPSSDGDKAPLFGHKNCNLPLDGYIKLIDTINALNTTDLTFASIIYGGSGNADIPELTTEANTIKVHEQVISYLREKNQNHGIYYSMGPHDLYPMDYQLFNGQPQRGATSGTPQAKLRESLDRLSAMDTAIDGSNVPSQKPNDKSSISTDTTARTSFRAAGFYTHSDIVYAQQYDDSTPRKTLKSFVKTDLRIISLNTNACYNRNFGLMQETDDAGGQLEWLKTTLSGFENENKKAWIIGNVSPGSKQCNSKWARRYNSIIERYQQIVRMQLFGHEAEDFFQLQFPESGIQNPYGVLFQGGKTSSLGQNPKFKIIESDYTHYMPRKITVYEFDLAKANAEPNAQAKDLIKVVKTMPDDFAGTSSLRPADLYALISRINNTESVAIEFQNKMCPTQNAIDGCVISECDDECRNQLACKLGNANQLAIITCSGIGLLDPEYGFEYAVSYLSNPWVEYHASKSAQSDDPKWWEIKNVIGID